MINTFETRSQGDRYNFKDYQEVIKQEYSTISPTHSLCTNCSDYYPEPPCQNDLNSHSGCFPSLISPDLN
ncbi:hypothetical protein Xen7305DRAFT_00004160 [Xenococcus sp. PCC 7305]|uniref:hypothetical protein n=1 Tax=Xenococcus sp. PCC 7305 TaxID=102125 RepID=UPI0002ABC707|nr:hypothetical protein [Xenococcus sp. PCC 7305]ELS00715.1 hypothetical protein Xen7305DRAFT_00004160 [Xenococcus sp. PCC 7305]